MIFYIFVLSKVRRISQSKVVIADWLKQIKQPFKADKLVNTLKVGKYIDLVKLGILSINKSVINLRYILKNRKRRNQIGKGCN